MSTKPAVHTINSLTELLIEYVTARSRQLIQASVYLGWMLLLALTWASPQQAPVLQISNIMFFLCTVAIVVPLFEVITNSESINCVLRPAAIALTFIWGIGQVGDAAFAHFASAPQDLAVVVTPFLLMLVMQPLLKMRHPEAEPGWVPPATDLPELSDSDRKHVAYHESAHALLHCAMRTPPTKLTMTLHRRRVRNAPNGIVHITPAHRLNRESYVRLRLLVLLAGQVGERMRMGETVVGGESDMVQWIQVAKHYLGSKEDTLYYPEPANSHEADHNAAALNRLRRQCIKQVQTFLERNEVAHRALADALIEREHMDLDDMRPFFRLASVPEDFPRPA